MASQSSQRSSQRHRGSQQTPSQSTQRRRSTQQANSQEDLGEPGHNVERMAAEVAQYMLIAEHKRLPVKKADLTKLIDLKGHASKTFKAVMSQAEKYLDEIFGYYLQEFEEKSGYYILSNQIVLPDNLIPQQKLSDSNTILFIVLSAIFLNGGQLTEDEAFNMLTVLGYQQEDCKKLIMQDFVKQLYISLDQIHQMGDDPKFNLLWGERAGIEFSKIEILQFASKIYGQSEESFGPLFQAAKADATQRSS